MFEVNTLISIATIFECIFAFDGYFAIAASISGLIFIVSLVWLIKSPHGEQMMMVSVATSNLLAFGVGGILFKMWPEIVACAISGWVIIGIILQVSLTRICQKNRL